MKVFKFRLVVKLLKQIISTNEKAKSLLSPGILALQSLISPVAYTQTEDHPPNQPLMLEQKSPPMPLNREQPAANEQKL